MVSNEAVSDFLVVALWSALLFCAGAGWAAYRALGWVERMRAWAYSVELDPTPDREPVGDTEKTCSGSRARKTEGVRV